jgi:hypothetical protein
LVNPESKLTVKASNEYGWKKQIRFGHDSRFFESQEKAFMKTIALMLLVLLTTATLAFGAASDVGGHSATVSGVPVQMVVTVQARRGDDAPVIHREDVMVYEGRERGQVTGWVPIEGSEAGLELFVLIDDAANTTDLGSQLADLRKFINAQPPSTKVGVAYMRNGTVLIAQDLTTDHALAAKAMRLTLGNPGASTSPYFSVADLIKRWPPTQAQREILMISDGIDRFYGSGPSNPYVETAIRQAQRAGIIVFSIYAQGAGPLGRRHVYWAQNYLTQTADETGGESYYLGFGAPVSFGPYLEDVTGRLSRQYLLTFIAKPANKDRMQEVKLQTEVPNAKLVAADRVYVPAGN